MIGNDIHPTTIVGIKRLAKALHKSEGIKHANALDLASTRAGFTNYRNALAALGSERTVPPKLLHTLFLTAYWREPHSIADGRETMELRLRLPWQSLVNARELRASRALSKFRGRAPDHLASKAMYFPSPPLFSLPSSLSRGSAGYTRGKNFLKLAMHVGEF